MGEQQCSPCNAKIPGKYNQMNRILLLLIASGALSFAADKYTVYETDHFELITDGSRGRAQEILAQFERVRSFFVKALATKDPVLKPRIVVFQNEKTYRDYAINAVSAAHYISLPQRDYIAMGPTSGDHDRRVAVHEYIHLLVRYTDTPLPVWMNEGIAELYSNIEQIKKVVRVGTPIPEHVFRIRTDWIPISEVVGAGHESKYYNRRQHAGPFYGISWALVHMLVLDDRYKNGFARLSSTLANGVEPEDAFRQVFSKSIAEVEKDLQTYIRANTIRVVQYEVEFDKVDEKVTPRPVTDYEWGVATADLLDGVRKHDQAAARLEALTNMQAQRPEAWESLTLVRWRARLEGADTAFAKARSLGSLHPNIGYYAAAFVKDKTVARDVLAAVVEKYPAYTDGRIRLAELQLYNREFQTSVNTLRSIPKITRRQAPNWFPAYIQASWYLGKVEDARSAASQFVRLSGTDADKERAKRWFSFAMNDPPKQRAEPVFTTEQTKIAAPAEEAEDAIEELPAMKFRRNPLQYATGTLVNLECKDPAVLHFKTDTGLLKVAIDSPTDFQMVGAAEGKGELTCGAQSRPAKLGYYPKEGLADGATAIARSIEFRP